MARASELASRGGLRVEWVGVEVLPVGLEAGDVPASGSSFTAGPGGTLRVFRLRFSHAYVTPLEAGLFVGTVSQWLDPVILAHVQTEGGVIVPVGGGALEAGLGAGVGVLALPYGNGCDGSCNVGGAGPILSPVARYRFAESHGWSVGLVMRAVLPLHVPGGNWFGYYTGRGALVLGGIDVAFGQ